MDIESKLLNKMAMILVSFSSARVAWFEDVKRYGTLKSQVTENPPFRFLWDTRYSEYCINAYKKITNSLRTKDIILYIWYYIK